ncbi:MAG: DUF2079 domain-containing protein [Candidatus Edwardsbacteria bacterium]|jgi:uncharacterized membrane protein|nr:DUF2079 domain-containing protein [Candidatus Edwardsbacteria bacterium]
MGHALIDNLLGVSLVAGAAVAAFLLASRRAGPGDPQAAKRWPWVAGALIAGYAAVFTVLPLCSYAAYNMGMVDLGHMDQAIRGVLDGRPLDFTFYETGQRVSRLGIHFEPVYFLIAPLYRIWDDARMLLVLQTAVIASGGIPLYLMARRRLGSGGAGIALLGAYLLHPALQFANLFEFHGDALAAGFLLWALHFMERRRWPLFAASLLLALACKEYVSLAAAGLGLAMALTGQRKQGVAVLIAGIIWFAAAQFWVIPHFRMRDGLYLEYTDLIYGDVPAMIARVLSVRNLGTLVLLLLPMGLLPVLSGWLLLPLIPILGGLMTGQGTFDLHNHHNAVLVPFLAYAAIAGWGRLSGLLGRRTSLSPARVRRGMSAGVLAASVSCTFFWGGSPLALRFWKTSDWYYHGQLHQYRVTRHDAITDSMIARIPSSVPVSASAEICPHLTHRRDCYMFPSPWITFVGTDAGRFDPVASSRVDVVCVDLLERFPLPNFSRARERETLARLLADTAWAVRDLRDGVLLLDRKPQGLAGDVREHDLKRGGPLTVRPGNGPELIQYALRQGQGVLSVTAEWAVHDTVPDLIMIDELYYGTRCIKAVHWPSYLLRRTAGWKRGHGYMETYQIRTDQAPDSIVMVTSTIPEAPIVTETAEIMPWSDQRILARLKVWPRGGVAR